MMSNGPIKVTQAVSTSVVLSVDLCRTAAGVSTKVTMVIICSVASFRLCPGLSR